MTLLSVNLVCLPSCNVLCGCNKNCRLPYLTCYLTCTTGNGKDCNGIGREKEGGRGERKAKETGEMVFDIFFQLLPCASAFVSSGTSNVKQS